MNHLKTTKKVVALLAVAALTMPQAFAAVTGNYPPGMAAIMAGQKQQDANPASKNITQPPLVGSPAYNQQQAKNAADCTLHPYTTACIKPTPNTVVKPKNTVK